MIRRRFLHCLLLATTALSFYIQQPVAAETMSVLALRLEKDPNCPITDGMVATIQSALEKQPKDASAHLALAICYERLGLPDQAGGEYQRAIYLGPDDPQAAIHQIKFLIRGGQSKIAMNLLEAAHSRFPDDPELLFWYGAHLAASNRTQEAEAIYKVALARDAKILGLASAMAQAKLDQGRYGDAIILADQDLKLDSKFYLAKKIKGIALASLGQYDRATEPLSEAYAQDPFREGVAHLYALTCIWSGDYKKALEPGLVFLAESSFVDSNFLLSSRNTDAKILALTIIRKLPPQIVAERCDQVGNIIDAKTHNAGFRLSLGDVLDSAHLPEQALEQYHAALAISPNAARGIFREGRDLEMYQHEYTQALECYKKAHELRPNDPEIALYYARLRDRIHLRPTDLAWNLKDWLSGLRPSKGN
jgi:tetratricopeptide (TPR) repeat protein